MLVDLGMPRGKAYTVIDGWLNGLQPVVIGENPRDLAAERLVHAVVVVGVQEASLLEPTPQPRHLFVREADIPVPVMKR